MDSALSDLDSLSLTVRDNRARTYIREAIAAYRAGAVKSAIISTWVAVAFDILTKIREVAQGGDADANAFVAAFDNAAAANNIQRLLALEADLLEKATGQFNFFGPHEFMQLIDALPS
jgi:hypothetical protein